MICNAKIYSVSVTLLRRLIVHFRMITQHHTLSYMCAKAFGSSKPPKSCEWSQHAGVGSLQGPSEWSPESSRRTTWRKHSPFQGAWKFAACWYPFGYGALLAALVRAWKNCPYFSNSHSDSCISVQTELIFDRLTGWFLLFDADDHTISYMPARHAGAGSLQSIGEGLKKTEEQLAEIISISQELEIMLHFWRSTVWSGCGWPQPNRKRVRFHTNIPHTHKHKHTHTHAQ